MVTRAPCACRPEGTSVSFASLPLCLSFVLAPLFGSSLPWVRAQGTPYLAVLALVFMYSHLYQNWCPDHLTRHDWKELIHLTPRSKPLGACAVRWMPGWCACVLCYYPATTKHQGPSNPRTTHVWYHARTSPDQCIMFSTIFTPSIKI